MIFYLARIIAPLPPFPTSIILLFFHPNKNFPLGNLRFLRVFFEFHGAFPPRKCLKSGGNTGSAFVLFLQVPRKSSVFGSNAEDLRKTGSWTRKKGAKVPCPTSAQPRTPTPSPRIRTAAAAAFSVPLTRDITGPGYLPSPPLLLLSRISASLLSSYLRRL